MDDTTHQDSKSWTPGWKLYLALAGAVFIVLAILIVGTDNASDNRGKAASGWTDQEISVFIASCVDEARELSAAHGMNDDQIEEYCRCSYKEISALYPEAPPEVHELDMDTVKYILHKCMKQATSDGV